MAMEKSGSVSPGGNKANLLNIEVYVGSLACLMLFICACEPAPSKVGRQPAGSQAPPVAYVSPTGRKIPITGPPQTILESGKKASLGSRNHRVPAIGGNLMLLLAETPEIKLQPSRIGKYPADNRVVMENVYFEGVKSSHDLIKPVLGGVQSFIIGRFSIALKDSDFTEGYLYTVDYGKIRIFFYKGQPSHPFFVMSDACFHLAVTSEQLSKLQRDYPRE